jgi:hypothetical protein
MSKSSPSWTGLRILSRAEVGSDWIGISLSFIGGTSISMRLRKRPRVACETFKIPFLVGPLGRVMDWTNGSSPHFVGCLSSPVLDKLPEVEGQVSCRLVRPRRRGREQSLARGLSSSLIRSNRGFQFVREDCEMEVAPFKWLKVEAPLSPARPLTPDRFLAILGMTPWSVESILLEDKHSVDPGAQTFSSSFQEGRSSEHGHLTRQEHLAGN